MNEQLQKQALLAHHIVMTNISIFHLLLPIIAFSTEYIKELIIFSVVISIALSSVVAKGAKDKGCDTFVSAHWRMAWRRSRYILVSYIISAGVMGLGWALTSTQTDPQMKKILLTTFIPMATVPTLLAVIVVLVLQTMTISRAKNGLVPNNII